MFIRFFGSEDKLVKTDCPLFDKALESLLKHLLAFGVPDLEKIFGVAMEVLNCGVYLHLNWDKLHLLVVCACSSVISHLVEVSKIN